MRIIGGKRRGLVIKSIDGETTRPTKDEVREALFNILANKIPESRFLDLFAGSGAIGIEAISRGAKEVVFSDINIDCVHVINENLEKAKFTSYSKVINKDFKSVLNGLKDSKFDIIYVDPPYNKRLGIEAINMISDLDILEIDGIIILETDTNEEVPEDIEKYERYNQKKYGRNILNMYRRKG